MNFFMLNTGYAKIIAAEQFQKRIVEPDIKQQ